MPRPTEGASEAFKALLPSDDAVVTRPMFGNLAAFVNGNMFAGLFGEALFVRLGDEAREQVLAEGGAPFSPMPGRAMAGYVTVPEPWLEQPENARAWVARSLAWSRELPAKQPKKSAKSRK
jgi:TfoX/Sxy family transcriptional regulator of competence genes